ncbi:serine protease 38-like [Contarinia nasturtii]|uniref:serine protease 38-like n=1 Tax=Contarinia nasturtii TaxID=265458 RepID=UPI0012D40E83|nr:serine protease 38-like [Contarinia nasturtii]
MFKFIIALLVVFTTSCESTVQIVNGKKTSIENYPWTASINVAWGFRVFAEFQCGAVIISERWLISNAHCNIFNILIFYQFVRVGSNYSTWYGEKHDIEKWVIHPDYVKDTAKNDVALIKLEEDLKYSQQIKPIPMVKENFIVSEGLIIKTAGFGDIAYDVPNHDVLMEAVFSACEPLYFKKLPNDSLICAIDHLEVETICGGDSGSGLIITINKQRLLLGVIYQSNEYCNPAFPLFGVSIPWYRHWIRNNTGI